MQKGVITAVDLVGLMSSGINPETQLKEIGDKLVREDILSQDSPMSPPVIDSMDAELQKVKEINRELEAVIESSFDGIGVISSDGMVLRVNTSYERMTGLSHDDNGVGRNVYDLEKEGHVSTAVALMVLQRQQAVTINLQQRRNLLISE